MVPTWRIWWTSGAPSHRVGELLAVPTKTQLSNFLGSLGENYFKRNPKSLNFYFVVIWWGNWWGVGFFFLEMATYVFNYLQFLGWVGQIQKTYHGFNLLTPPKRYTWHLKSSPLLPKEIPILERIIWESWLVLRGVFQGFSWSNSSNPPPQKKEREHKRWRIKDGNERTSFWKEVDKVGAKNYPVGGLTVTYSRERN